MDTLDLLIRTWPLIASMGVIGLRVFTLRIEIERNLQKQIAKIEALEKDSARCEKRLEAYEEDIKHLENRLLQSIDEMKSMLHETKVEVTRSVAEMKHMNKDILAVKAEDLARYHGLK